MTDDKEICMVELADDEAVKRDRLLAAARLAIMLAAQVAMVLSWTVDVDLWTSIAVTAVDLYFLARHVWWPNNNVTKEAVAAGQVKDLAKLNDAIVRLVPKNADE